MWHGGMLGQYQQEGEFQGAPYYNQTDTQGRGDGWGWVLYYNPQSSVWVVNYELHGDYSDGYLRVPDTDPMDGPPATGWFYGKWIESMDPLIIGAEEPTLTVVPGPLELPCSTFNISGTGEEATIAVGHLLGRYRQTDEWSRGRRVYRKGDGSVLFVRWGQWTVCSSLDWEDCKIQISSSKVTNDPRDAGQDKSERVSGWQYRGEAAAPGDWVDDGISVTCDSNHP